ncbi:MAG TPA: MG2 domain-containing protein, partial [Myxococcaceae bacterium]|nr:MG2 domain-containing protein [Myxococcaceae bacterium]
VTAAHIAKFLAFKADGQNLHAPQIRQAAPNAVTVNVSDGRIRPSARLVLEVQEGLPDAGGRATAPRATASLTLSDGAPVRILAARVREGAEGFHVEVVCNDEAAGSPRYYWDREAERQYSISRRCRITDESARRFIRFTPHVDFHIGPAAVGFRVLGDFKRGRYAMTIAAGAATLDGGILLEAFNTEATIPARAPKLQFAASGRYLPRSAWKNLAVQHVNVDEAELVVRRIPPENLIFWLSQEQQEVADARTSDVILKKKIRLRSAPDQRATTWVDLASMVPSATRGVLEISLRAGEAAASSRLLLTDMSLVAKRSATPAKEPWRHEARVWALGMESNELLPGVALALKRRSGKSVAECTTAADGSCVLAVKQRVDDDDSEPFAIVARRGDDLTYVRYADLRTATSDFAVHGEPYGSERVYRAAAWSDRGVYRPGDTAHVAAIIRGRDALAPPAGLPVDLKVTDPRGRVSRELHLHTNDAGLVQAELPFPSFADTGKYRVVLSVAQKDAGALTFNVEEFVPERMKVEASTATENYAFGDTAKVEVRAKYLFGGSAAGSRVELTCSLEPSVFKPEENASFVFGTQLNGDTPDEAEEKPVSLGQSDATLDASGKAALECPELAATGFRGGGRLVAAAAVFEAGSGRSTQSRATAAVHPAPFYLGLKTAAVRADAGTPFRVEGILVDWKGRIAPKSARAIDVELFRLEPEYGYFWDEEEGTERFERNLRPVQEGTLKVEVKEGRFAFDVRPAAASAAYLVRAKSGNARTDLRVEGEVTGEYFWFGAQARVDQTPRPLKPTTLVIHAPTTVRVGEVVKVAFKAPFKGRVLITAETDRILEWKWMAVQAGEVTWEFKLESFVPNVYVSAFLVKDPHLESAESFLPDRAFGVASATVAPVAFTQELKLSVPKEVRSNSRLEVAVDAGPADGPAYVAVAVVDEGVLSLTRFASPNPIPEIFARRALGVETYETI